MLSILPELEAIDDITKTVSLSDKAHDVLGLRPGVEYYFNAPPYQNLSYELTAVSGMPADRQRRLVFGVVGTKLPAPPVVLPNGYVTWL